MGRERAVTFADLERARDQRDPELGRLIIQYVQQPDPPENEAEDAEPDPSKRPAPLGPDAWTMQRMRQQLSKWALYGKTADERRAIRKTAWEGIENADFPPPRLKLGDMLLALYDDPDPDGWARTVIIEVIQGVKIGWGVWKGIKGIYKRSEERYDAEIFGLLAWRFDAIMYAQQTYEVGGATFSYMRRRAWRFLRQLGRALPELYPEFAVEVLRHYDARYRFYSSWVGAQIFAHENLIGATSSWIDRAPKDLSKRAYDEAWKQTPAPLLRLLEQVSNDAVADFTIRSLQRDFPESLRNPQPDWLKRIAARGVPSTQRFVVETMQASPELHQSKLKGLGLHEMVLDLLESSDAAVVAYAVEYANAHAPDIDADRLLRLVAKGQPPARELATARLEAMDARALGLDRLITMVRTRATSKLASEKITAAFTPADLSAEQYFALRGGNREQQQFVAKFYKDHDTKPPARFLVAAVERDTVSYYVRRQLLQELGKYPAREIGVEWIQNAVLEPNLRNEVSQWLRRGMLKGDELDVEWLKGLTMRPSTRSLAIAILQNRDLVAPHRVGLGWLLAMSRQPDPQLADFARLYLLRNFGPSDFASGGDEAAGVEKLWALTSPDQVEPVRLFACLYLRVHHPKLGPATEQARKYGIQPRLPRDAYTLERVKPLFDDAVPEIRRFAVAVGRQEIVRWGDRALPYRLSVARNPEPRKLGTSTLLAIGVAHDDAGGSGLDASLAARAPVEPVPKDWLDASQVFQLAESAHKAAREAALSLVSWHYAEIGGARRVAWLMESPERDVRIFAVRLLWENRSELAETEDDVSEALRQFVRTVLFGLPPGRMPRRGDDALPTGPIPASVAKRRLVEVVREMSVEEAGFARIAAPVLEEIMESRAKGEWHACVTALARIRRAHPEVVRSLPAPERRVEAAQ